MRSDAAPDDSGNPGRTSDDAKDRAHWEAVDEATELLHEERFREALVVAPQRRHARPAEPVRVLLPRRRALRDGRDGACARRLPRRASRLAPKHLGARVALTHILRQIGDLREALKEGTTALAQAPGDADALHAIGLVHLARGDDAAARRYLEAFLASKPELEVAMEVRGILDGLDKGLS